VVLRASRRVDRFGTHLEFGEEDQKDGLSACWLFTTCQ